MKPVTNKEEAKKSVPAVQRRELLSPFASVQQEMNKLFEELRSGWGFAHTPQFEPFGDFHARVDMKDSEKEVIVTAELPGVDLKDIDITVKGDSLILKGEKKMEKEEKDKGYYKMERSYGSFYRSIPLPCEIEKDNVDAVFKDGVLTVTMPKTKAALTSEKQISVKAG